MNMVNFTELLSENSNMYLFNPSIAHWRNDLYLCVYRRFIRYPKLYQKTTKYNYSEIPTRDPNHPWLGGIGSETWWKSFYGQDNTGIVLLQINGSKCSVVRNYKNNDIFYMDELEGKKRNVKPIIKGVDARLLYINDNKFVLSYNTFLSNRNDIQIKNNKKCTDFCGLISSQIIEINNDYELVIYPASILCTNISNKVEKNWSFWKTQNNDLVFSYGLVPKHDIYKLAITQHNTIKCNGLYNSVESASLLKAFGTFYKNKVFISVSTPAVVFENNMYIGVGHIKYKYKDIEKLKGTNLYNFTELMKQEKKILHSEFIYLMFFYIFNQYNGNILMLSHMFLPKSKFALCFPSGLTKTVRGNFLISYGDGDTKCKYLILTKDYIKNLLAYSSGKFIPSKVEFKMLE